ncbi:MAG: acetyl/propionyl/methylcrotonyl-CoA carboxylase subunit alpha [Pseudomonadota bacterium]
MFRKILIANRGEIACRIIDTCRKLGVKTVAVHSEVDQRSRHVALADQAVSLGGAAPAESYLRAEAIIEAALKTGAQAIHPGYGFLSENPDFVDAVEAAGLVFVGPSADAIRAMGLKDAAKAAMEAAGVPVVPGYHGSDQSNGHLAKAAGQIGYPVLIKAVAGGGGKGMRLVETASAFEQALSSARAEAQAAFGNSDVLIEKFVSHPRHIEVQIFGDGTSAVHLFERDCSLQRRHQKVIEEAPAPGMDEQMRAAMGEAAIRAAKAVGYSGAGTVEFIVDGSDGLRADRFFFMEMNTRLQVEHPVTEAITGVDLVEWQLRVAAGQPIPRAQEQLEISGHAFEARLYAEDVAAGFLPATGTLRHLRFPDEVRIDTGVREGDEISPYYDPMIAKITVHGRSRAEALRRLDLALSQTEIAGTLTNLSFLQALSRHDGFSAERVDTGLIARDAERLCTPPLACDKTRALAVLWAQEMDSDRLTGFSLWQPFRKLITLSHAGDGMTGSVEYLGQSQARVTPNITHPEITYLIETKPYLRINGQKIDARFARLDGSLTVFWGNSYQFDWEDPLDRRTKADQVDLTRAPMPGLVKEVFVEVGAFVQEGSRLVTLEAMKMEHILVATRDGIVGEVCVSSGAQVKAGDQLILLQEEIA